MSTRGKWIKLMSKTLKVLKEKYEGKSFCVIIGNRVNGGGGGLLKHSCIVCIVCGRSERAYYLSYFINSGVTKVVSDKFESRCWGLKGHLTRSKKVKRTLVS